MSGDDRRPLSPAERMRRYREKQRTGQTYYRFRAIDIDVEEHLIAAGILDENDRDDQRMVERALAAFFAAMPSE